MQHELELWDLSRKDDCRARALEVALALANSLESIIAALSQPTAALKYDTALDGYRTGVTEQQQGCPGFQ